MTMCSIGARNPVIQTVYATSNTFSSITTVIPYDTTIPQNTEGSEVLTLAITPSSASSILEIYCEIPGQLSDDETIGTAALFQDATANAIAAVQRRHVWGNNNNGKLSETIKHIMVAGTVSSTTFKVRVGTDIGSAWSVNGGSSSRLYGGTMTVILTINEYYA